MHTAMTSQSQSEQLQATRMPAMSMTYPIAPVTVQRPPPPVAVQRPSASVTVQRPPAPVAVPRPPVPTLPSGYATAIRPPYSQSNANIVRPQFGGGGATARPLAPPQLQQTNLQSRIAMNYGGVRGPKTPPPKDAGARFRVTNILVEMNLHSLMPTSFRFLFPSDPIEACRFNASSSGAECASILGRSY